MPNSKIIMYLTLIIFFTNIKFSKQIESKEMSIQKNDNELGIFNITYEDENIQCKYLVPSLFIPVLLIPFINYGESKISTVNAANYPLNYGNDDFVVFLFNYILDKNYNLILGEERFTAFIKQCYLGLSLSAWGFNDLNENFTILNKLKDNSKIKQKIFSFDKWIIENDRIKTYFYFGEEHNNFVKKDDKKAIIGECKVNENLKYWGCLFNKMSINNNTEDLIKENSTDLYEIYFSTEEHDIIFPKKFLSKFLNLSDNKCIYNSSYEKSKKNYIVCENFFDNKENYAELQLINDNMTITIEIDNQKRFTIGNEDKINISRILFREVDYFIFPLIMFKKFHIQFDAENNNIKFYTTDKNILQIIKKKEKEKKSSKTLTVFLIIVIIILVLGLGYGVFWFLKKRRGSVEKNINKYNKFDEDETFKDMNEKRVF